MLPSLAAPSTLGKPLTGVPRGAGEIGPDSTVAPSKESKSELEGAGEKRRGWLESSSNWLSRWSEAEGVASTAGVQAEESNIAPSKESGSERA